MLATDPEKREFFPYRKQGQRHNPVNSEKDRRMAALRAHWLKLKRRGKYQVLAETVLAGW